MRWLVLAARLRAKPDARTIQPTDVANSGRTHLGANDGARELLRRAACGSRSPRHVLRGPARTTLSGAVPTRRRDGGSDDAVGVGIAVGRLGRAIQLAWHLWLRLARAQRGRSRTRHLLL